jgi:hypothetical protein
MLIQIRIIFLIFYNLFPTIWVMNFVQKFPLIHNKIKSLNCLNLSVFTVLHYMIYDNLYHILKYE